MRSSQAGAQRPSSQATNVERVASTVYGLTLLTGVRLLSLLWRYTLRRGL